MVEVSILLEGGVHPNSNASADTFDNSERLRESFHQLLSRGLNNTDKIRIEIDTKASYTSVIKAIKSGKEVSSNTLALLDLDGDESQRDTRIVQYGLEEYRDFVFFMIQTMEGWILSQPDAIEKTFVSYDKIIDLPIAENELLKGLLPQSISQPDKVLNSLLLEYYQDERGGKIKKVKYGKLKNSYLLIEQLDINELRRQFADVNNLLNKINDLTIDA
ncbi:MULTISPECIES: DUF4276 family protein [unclassified Arcicella]|uniref:DUF4276 family protein n=1 Tax=unclassified Arcicella TaxID=2644986 RepID=UPI00285F8A6B|nr:MULTISPECIES: DUF4276 family protein [unclassified Arcicella]MDR6560193.1 hypothetical protein [Arcicella sp. BE51]MDR6810200.1 hypothetical protein [Arcicella sp. BE140]MDR6821550.1 hypothetical protein [Arcicella sp. BE139]